MYGMWRQGIFQGGFGATNTQAITFITGNGSNSAATERMRITGGGNVGIGTTGPSGIFHVRATSITAAAPSLGWPVYNPEADTNARNIYIDTDGNGSVSTAGYGATVVLQLGQYYDSRVVITPQGNGGASPGDQGTGRGKDLMLKAGTSDNNAGYKGGRLYLNGGMGYQSAFNTNVGDILMQTLTGGGNVGIGTTSPTHTLYVDDGSYNRLAVRVGAPNVANTAGRWTGIGLSGEEANTKGGILFESLGTSYSRGKIHIAINNTADQTNVSTSDAILTVIPAGNVGIGSTSPAYALDVSGTIRATGDVIAYSDARVKDNVTTVENALDKIKSLRGVNYTRKDDETKALKVGVIAQEVLPILPEVVQQDTDGNYSVAYGNMVGVLIEAIKEQQRQIEDLKYLLSQK